jgi:hypothetical protein
LRWWGRKGGSGTGNVPAAGQVADSSGADAGRWRLVDPQRVTVYAPEPAALDDLLARVGPLGTGETFCAMDPDGGEDLFSATISDTVATFVIQVTQDPQFGTMPAAAAESGWDPAKLTGYEISVATDGPGGQRLRFRLAKAVVEAVGAAGLVADASGAQISVDSLADPTWGSLW